MKIERGPSPGCGVRGAALLLIAALATARSGVGQTPESAFEGGHFEVEGTRLDVSAADFGHHFEFVRRLNPNATAGVLMPLAWARAIRVTAARHLGLDVDEGEFRAWMRERHRSSQGQWLSEGRDPAIDRLRDWVLEQGFDTIADYESACREEYLGELFVAREFPRVQVTTEETQAWFERMNTLYVVDALVVAPETLEQTPALDPEDEGHQELFAKWWSTLSDQLRRTYDDDERPALEAEVLYVRLDDHTQESFRSFFESPRPELGGSFAKLTANEEPTPLDRSKLYERWSQFRRTGYARVNNELPDGLSDEASFPLVEGHLVRDWRMARYVGRVWKTLRDRGPGVDMKAAAAEFGLSYRHFPFAPLHTMYNDEELRGTHYLTLRKIAPGTIYDYHTSPETSIYYAEGIVDQPGFHVSVWKLVRAEEMRVLEPRSAARKAWPDFERAVAWQAAKRRLAALESSYREYAESVAGSRLTELDPAVVGEERARRVREIHQGARNATWTEVVEMARDTRVVGPLYVRPFRDSAPSSRARADVDTRVLDRVRTEWVTFAGLDQVHEPGDVLTLPTDDTRRVGGYVRIREVVPPSARNWNGSPLALTSAAQQLEQLREAERVAGIRNTYAWPNIVLRFKLVAPELDRVMAETLGRDR